MPKRGKVVSNPSVTTDAASQRPKEPVMRMRIRFAKQGDLRFSSHRDLVRAIERLFRRAEVAVRMSEGFHPKPRMMFPSALGLGTVGRDEVFDVDLDEAREPAELVECLQAQAPPGLELLSAEVVPLPARKAQAAHLTYGLPLPADRVERVQAAVDRINAAGSLLAQREGREAPVDLRATLVELAIDGGVLRMTLRATHTAQARPRDILELLELADLEFSAPLARTRVELKP
jgi:radical SAM-linked protein